MEPLLSDILTWMMAVPTLWVYAALFTIAIGENLIPPVPGDLVVVFAGYMVGVGYLSLPAVVLVASAGGAIGFMGMYAVGYWLGDRLEDPARFAWLPRAKVERVKQWLARRGYQVVLANRFLSGLRSVIGIGAGAARLDPLRTMGVAGLSALAWTLLTAYAGYALGENWSSVLIYLKAYGVVVVGLLIAGTTIYMAVDRVLVRRKRLRPE
jgi:membrane protein DedA with SNARE-associated domain